MNCGGDIFPLVYVDDILLFTRSKLNVKEGVDIRKQLYYVPYRHNLGWFMGAQINWMKACIGLPKHVFLLQPQYVCRILRRLELKN